MPLLARSVAGLTTVGLFALLPAMPSGGLVPVAPQVPDLTTPVGSAAEVLTVYTEYTDRAEVEIHDLRTGRITRFVDHPHTEGLPGSGGEPDHADEAATPTEPAAGSSSTRCTNDAEWNYLSFGSSGTRIARPWHFVEEVRFNPAGAPVAFDWQGEIMAGSDVWQDALNPCGRSDTVGWVTPPVGAESVAPPGNPNRSCPAADNENTIGWVDYGGWATGSLLLAQACMWSSPGLAMITEGDLSFNRHPDAVWCDGACSGGWDLRSVASHEWGHYLGLGHTCGDGDIPACSTDAQRAAVMFPFIDQNDVKNRSLSAGDLAGAHDLYPHAWGYEVVSVALENPAGDGVPLSPGHTYTARVQLRNTGLEPWAVGAPPVALGSHDDQPSPIAAADWLSPAHATHADAEVSGWVHSRVSGNTSGVIARDEVAEFTFGARIPFSYEPGSDTASFVESLAPHGAAFDDGGTADLPLEVGTLSARVIAQTGPTLLGRDGVVAQGLQSAASVTVENTGTAPWFRNDGLLRLSTDPAGSCSPWQGADWTGCTTASVLDTGTIIQPGATSRFNFQMSSPVDPSRVGEHEQAFDVEVVGRSARLAARSFFEFVVL